MLHQFEGFSLQEQLQKAKKEINLTNACQLLCPAVLRFILLIAMQVICNFYLESVCKWLSPYPFWRKDTWKAKGILLPISTENWSNHSSIKKKKKNHPIFRFQNEQTETTFIWCVSWAPILFQTLQKHMNAWACIRNVKRRSRRFLKDTWRKVIIYLDCNFLCILRISNIAVKPQVIIWPERR